MPESAGDLDLDLDPKAAWALRHRAFFPVDVNLAPREALLRVPGFGVRTVERILQARRYGKLSLADLGRMRTPVGRAADFIMTTDHHPRLGTLESAGLRLKLSAPAEQLLLPLTRA